MGIIAEAIMEYAQPLIDSTDGSFEQVDKAMQLAMTCYNLSLLPDEHLEEAIGEMQAALGLNDEEFADFRQNILMPMIERHHRMFPGMRRLGGNPSASSPRIPAPHLVDPAPVDETAHLGAAPIGPTVRLEKASVAGRNEPCPCGSGKKYKRCCGR